MRGIVNTTLAISPCETPNIAAAGGQEIKAEAGTSAAQGINDSFKKKLQDCQAMMGPTQQKAVDGSTTTTEDGVQGEPTQGVSGVGCIFEGFEMPVIPPGETQTATTATDAAAAMMPMDGTGNSADVASGQAQGTPGQIAGTQNTTAGPSPVITQDDILKTVGAYLDAAAETGTTKPASAAQQAPGAQTAASPAEQQNPAEKPITAAAEAAPERRPAVGVANPQAEARSEDHAEANANPNQAAIDATTKSDSASTDTASKKTVAAEKPMQTEVSDKAAQPINANAVTDARTAPVTQEAAPADMADAKTAEAAHYAKENVLRIVDKVSTHAAEGKYDFDVELKPDFMGKVSIKVTMEGDSIRMQIKTDDMSVKGMLTDQTTSLQNALKDKGITLTSVDVSYDNQASLSGEQQQPYERGDGGGRQSSVYYATQSEPAGYEPAAETYGGYYVGNSSVEFLA